MEEIARKMILEKIDEALKDVPHRFGIDDIKVNFSITIKPTEKIS